MASCNSDSLQSSSGGDEEYDSRSAESFPTFLNDPTFPFGVGLSNSQSSVLSLHHHHTQNQNHPSSFFDPSTGYNLHSSNPNANALLLNLDVSRPVGARSDVNSNSNYGTLQGPPEGLNSISSGPATAVQSLPEHKNVPRNPRKRTRASRRAPTTVLTTDTTNFRAMVQEFTGTPMAPFSGGGSYSRRLDLFGPGSSLRSSHLDPLRPLFPIRPAAQKFQPIALSSSSPSPSLLNNIMLDPSNDMSNPRTNNVSSIGGTTIDTSDQVPFPRQPQDMLNVPNNSYLTFQSLLQPPLAAPNNVSSFVARSSQGSLNLSSYEELSSLGQGRQLDTNLDVLASDEGRQQEDNQVRPRFGEGNCGDASQRVNRGCKSNFSAAPLSEFRGEKGLEDHGSVSVGRGEGTVDSWICPSD